MRPVVEKVRTDGDEALVSYTRTFDKADISGMPIEVQPEEFERAETSVPDDLKRALEFSIENVRRFHQHQISEGQTFHEIRPGILAGEKPMPVDSAGLYVPRGRGSFPSMLYMLAVPASVAGVPDIAVATPPGEDGSVDPACLYAARLCGVNRIYRVGGAQAVAALAYGTASVQPVHKIIGPGSMYVAAAKRIVGSVVDTGLPAGPSESAVLADGSADPESVAVDLLIESEHGSDSSALLVTPSEKLAGRVADILPGLIDALPEPRKNLRYRCIQRLRRYSHYRNSRRGCGTGQHNCSGTSSIENPGSLRHALTDQTCRRDSDGR